MAKKKTTKKNSKTINNYYIGGQKPIYPSSYENRKDVNEWLSVFITAIIGFALSFGIIKYAIPKIESLNSFFYETIIEKLSSTLIGDYSLMLVFLIISLIGAYIYQTFSKTKLTIKGYGFVLIFQIIGWFILSVTSFAL